MWRLNNMLLNNQWITEDIKEEIKKYLDTNGRRQWHPTPVLLSRKSHGWRSLVGCSPWGRWASDTTERLHFHFSLSCIGEGNGNPLQCSCLGRGSLVGCRLWGHRIRHDWSDLAAAAAAACSPWNSPGQNIAVGSLSLLQGIFPTQGQKPSLPHCRQIVYQLSH